MRSLHCYRFQCSSSTDTYEKTIGLFKIRVSEHMGFSARTSKSIKSTKNPAGRDDMLWAYAKVRFLRFSW